MKEKKGQLEVLWIAVAVALAVLALPSVLVAKQQEAKGKTFAQALVEQTLASHPESDEVGIAVRSSRGCKTIASTDKSDLDEACEKDDIQPMQTGKPYVEKEKDGYDVSVPLRDARGKIIGSVGIGFKPKEGQTQEEVIAAAEKIAKEMSAQIASRTKLFQKTA